LHRDQLRRAQKLAASRRKLVALEAGGSPERPAEVPSASVVEARAQSWPCPDCGGPLRCREHRAERHHGELLRCAELECRACGAPLTLYFRLGQALAH
jgi:hypothetical protein